MRLIRFRYVRLRRFKNVPRIQQQEIFYYPENLIYHEKSQCPFEPPVGERLGLRDLAVLVGMRPSQRREAGEEAVIRLQHLHHFPQ